MILINEIEIIDIPEENKFIVINLLNGNADILDIEYLDIIKNNKLTTLVNDEIKNCLIERNYIFETYEEYEKYLKEINDYLLKELVKQPPNFIYIPTYKCNLRCYYCFEETYEKNEGEDIINNDIDTFFNAIKIIAKIIEDKNNINYDNKDILVDITGGEPLLLKNRDTIERILYNVHQNGYKINIITNGTTIDKYMDILKKYKINGIQVTLDGDKETHNKIRVSKDGKPTFDKIVSNIKSLSTIVNSISIRINLTNKNINTLDNLADELEQIIGFDNVYIYLYFTTRRYKRTI
ncbi:radical SAM protein [uncultured Tyzzerella sp.]|uniref:radical SAM protein n=1 Tax=uncultured Tyzzerella sp. TaxID=2321398 RepID=UPI0029422FEA|nr:radical SAM protein [uncultured Tyzzerella sp.]